MPTFLDRYTLLPRTSVDHTILKLGCSYLTAYQDVLFLAAFLLKPMLVDVMIRLLRICHDLVTLFRDYSCFLMYNYVLFPVLFLSKSMFDDAFVLILCNCLDYAKYLRHYSCFLAHQDASRQAHSFEFLARDGTGPLKYDIGPTSHRYMQTILPLGNLQFGILAYVVAPKTFHHSTRTHPCALSAQSFLPNSSRDHHMPVHSIPGPRWLRAYTLHAPLNSTGVAANPG